MQSWIQRQMILAEKLFLVNCQQSLPCETHINAILSKYLIFIARIAGNNSLNGCRLHLAAAGGVQLLPILVDGQVAAGALHAFLPHPAIINCAQDETDLTGQRQDGWLNETGQNALATIVTGFHAIAAVLKCLQ